MFKNNKIINCLIVGAGGIGSYLAQHLDKLIELDQIKNSKYTFYDDDVVEIKNMWYQNFDENDVDDLKVDALSFKYFHLAFKNKRLIEEDLKNNDLIILCADNNIIRKATWYNWVNNKIPFIDSRANGRAFGIFSNETRNYLNTIDNSTSSSSCQNPFQLAKKEIEYGNVVVAAYLAQCLLNYDRKKILPVDFMINI